LQVLEKEVRIMKLKHAIEVITIFAIIAGIIIWMMPAPPVNIYESPPGEYRTKIAVELAEQVQKMHELDELLPKMQELEPQGQGQEQKEYLGIFTIFAYCPCAICCGKWASSPPRTASGTIPQEGRTVAADWDVIPAGAEIEIEGIGIRTVEDKPAGWVRNRFNGKILDVYFEDHGSALKFGKQELQVWLLDTV
jgi:3D (Asp-Asp-Asp) domain-containing protein